MHIELTKDGNGGPSYWTLRRAAVLLQALTAGADLSEYRKRLDEGYASQEAPRQLYTAMSDNGFDMLPFDQALEHAISLRSTYDAQLEYLIDTYDTPRGFWGHRIGHPFATPGTQPVESRGSVFDRSDLDR